MKPLSAEEAEKLEKKKRLKSKELARRPKKLKQQTLNLFLEDESTEEQEEHAGGSAAGSRQATSDEKISTGKGSQAASLPDQPGQNPAVELD